MTPTYPPLQRRKTVANKPLAFMGVEVKIQMYAFRKIVSDYPQYSVLETPHKQEAKRYAQG